MSDESVKEERVRIVVPIDIDVQRLRDLLCSAVEGGSNYWAGFRKVHQAVNLDYLGVEVVEHESHDDGPRVRRMIAAEDLAKGLERLGACAVSGMMPDNGGGKPMPFPGAMSHLANFLQENDDAETADVVLQLTVFGTLIYG
jgi:hypothetical protein